MRIKISLLGLAALVVSGLTLAGCDDAEQGRLLSYEPGKYLGQPDTALTVEQRDELRRRAAGQSGG